MKKASVSCIYRELILAPSIHSRIIIFPPLRIHLTRKMKTSPENDQVKRQPCRAEPAPDWASFTGPALSCGTGISRTHEKPRGPDG